MIAISIGRIAVPSLALAALGGALVYGITHVRREPPVEIKVAAFAPAVVPPASDARAEGPARETPWAEANTAKANASEASTSEVNMAAEALAASRPAPNTDNSVPTFDVARIERSGEAVIAGRVAPGATVELLRNGERLDQAVADQSGQFVMVPAKLPPGDYELTLRSTLPNGRQATSKQSVTVALGAMEPGSGAVRSRAEVPFNVPETTGTNRSVLRQAAGSAQARLPSDAGAPSAVVGPKNLTAVATVSRGDSLWRISRATYGEGMRYAFVYKANREQIRNPNRIYPGQILVLPVKEH